MRRMVGGIDLFPHGSAQRRDGQTGDNDDDDDTGGWNRHDGRMCRIWKVEGVARSKGVL